MNRLPSANFFATKAFVGQKLATSVAEHATSVRKAKTSGNKKKTKTSQKNKTAQNDKSEKDKKNSKAKANVTAKTTDSNKSVVDTGAKTKSTNSSKTAKQNKNKKVKKNSNKKVSALKGGVKEKSIHNAVISSSVANNESKKVHTKNRNDVREGDDHGHHEQAIKKMGKTLSGVAIARIEDHPLDYSPEALLVDHEEVYLHDKEDASHLVGGSNVLETDPHLGGLREQTAEEEVDVLDDLEDVTEFPLDESTHIPKRYREGTAGGKLFEEQTLAEIDGYLYLGKVGMDSTFRPAGSAGSITEYV